VAGFVGTSNLLEPEAAEQLLGVSGTVSIRPEKIRLQAEDQPRPEGPDVVAVAGTVTDVVYLGSATHSVVELAVGGRLSVMQQNTESSLEHVMARRGERVLLTWQRAHVVTLAARHEPDQEDEQPATVG
jgi:putative spermidine/putrescine transport system ATP-binding protein